MFGNDFPESNPLRKKPTINNYARNKTRKAGLAQEKWNSTTAMHPAGRKEEEILASGEKRWSDHGRRAQCTTGATLQSEQHVTSDAPVAGASLFPSFNLK